MKQGMRQLDGQRIRFTATIERFGEKSAFKGPPIPTILLKDVKHDSEQVADHTWMTIGNWSRNLKIGDKIEFDARVTTYMKGYMGRRDDVDAAPIEKDYKLSRPTKIKVLS